MTQYSTLTPMTQRKNIFIQAMWVLVLVLTSCTGSDNQTKQTASIDTSSIPTSPKPNPVTTIDGNTTGSFLNQTEEIRPNKNANKPFAQLDYNKVIAYDYDGGK